ncbi:hypothetical protein OR1_03187 [Geobacter sp. OR-1]|uniref:hypothetical protein n=1 Tax=Geobacter sp. OR-1 TaxID=1266765 RepID=UPI0005422813|nr:hypothetical protein [Geobacter sp. OR-1]GAM10887.1 hypothetical protein OR1_03187 [Geobacter sp. OR-1]
MKRFMRIASSLLLLFTLAACGGGGGSNTVPANTIVSGIASKGLIINGTVRIYALVNGTKGALLATVPTNDQGYYSADIGSYVGPVMAEASGAYLDEATGTTKTVPDNAPIHAALPLAQGTVSLPVTALTELAVQKADNLTPEAITAANTLVSEIFKVDIVTTLPVAPTATALADATQAQKDYTLALATVSQVSKDTGTSLENTLTTLAQGITSSGMSTATVATVQAALTTFVTTNSNNRTGVTNTAETNVANAGTLSKSYTLALQGTIAAGAIRGIQFNLVLPPGVTLNINSATSAILDSSLKLPADGVLAAKYANGAATIGIVNTSGLSVGTLATLTCNITATGGAPAATAFSVTNLKAVNEKGSAITGVTVIVQ